MSDVKIYDDLIGQTILKINRKFSKEREDQEIPDGAEIIELEFLMESGRIYRMWHDQDCCEWVHLDDIEGELSDLIGAPLEMAEEVTDTGIPDGEEKYGSDDSHTWTFYKFATAKGYVTLKWYGESNGYYSESMEFERVEGS